MELPPGSQFGDPPDSPPLSPPRSPARSPGHNRRRSGRFGLEMYNSMSGSNFDLFTAESDSSLYMRADDEQEAPEFSESDISVGRRGRPVSTSGSSIRHRYDVVAELGSEEVRWFYREERKGWKPFIGYDSLRIELMYREQQGTREAKDGSARPPPESVCVRGGLYEVNVMAKQCYPVYWHRKCCSEIATHMFTVTPCAGTVGVPGIISVNVVF